MVFSNIYSIHFGLVLNLLNVSMSLQFNIIFGDMLYTVVIIIASDSAVFIWLV